MIYEGDADKAAANARKHGVSFDEVRTVFLDPVAETFDDPDHSTDESRLNTIRSSARQRVLFGSADALSKRRARCLIL